MSTALKAPAKLTREQARSFVIKTFAARQPDVLAGKYHTGYEPGAWVIDAVMNAYEVGLSAGRGSSLRLVHNLTGKDVDNNDNPPTGEVPMAKLGWFKDFWKPTPTSSYWLGVLIASVGWALWIWLYIA